MEARRAYSIVVREVRRARGEKQPEVREALHLVKRALRLEPLPSDTGTKKPAARGYGCSR